MYPGMNTGCFCISYSYDTVPHNSLLSVTLSIKTATCSGLGMNPGQ